MLTRQAGHPFIDRSRLAMEYEKRHLLDSMRRFTGETSTVFNEILYAPKRDAVADVSPCLKGYIFAESSTKPGQVLAYPSTRESRPFSCMIFDMSGPQGKFKGF